MIARRLSSFSEGDQPEWLDSAEVLGSEDELQLITSGRLVVERIGQPSSDTESSWLFSVVHGTAAPFPVQGVSVIGPCDDRAGLPPEYLGYTEAMKRQDLAAFPGGDLIERGFRDLQAGRLTTSALLVLVGATRMRRLGLEIPEWPERQLYLTLEREQAEGAHSRYNALIRRLVSFERAAECAA